MIKRRFFLALLAGFISTVFANEPSKVLSDPMAQKLHFATEASYFPFEFVDKNNKIQGFDIDIANAVCNVMKAICAFSNQGFDSLILGLKFKRFDAVISGVDITVDREKQALFSDPYYNNSATFIARKGEIESIEGLKGKKVGIQNGTTHQRYLQEKRPDIATVAYGSYQEALLDLKNGRIDAVFGDTAVINAWLKQDPNKDKKQDKIPILTAVGEKITDKAYFGSGLGIAVRKNNIELQRSLNEALKKIKSDGTYERIYKKWFEQAD